MDHILKSIFFLEDAFILRYFPIAGLPEKELGVCRDFAKQVNDDQVLRLAAWRLQQNYLSGQQLHPEEADEFGKDTGLLNVLLALSLIPSLEERMKREGIPVDYAYAAARRIGTLPFFFAQLHDGKFGIRTRSLPFLLNYKNEPMFRIGRFDFLLTVNGEALPDIYRQGKEVAAWCKSEWFFSANGHRVADSSNLTGGRINLANGRAEIGQISSKNGYIQMVKEGGWGLFFHIPGGEAMTLDYCIASFRDALKFFHCYYADKPVELIHSNSWIFNPAWLDYLPDGNMSALIQFGHLFPAVSTGLDGLYFVFGKEDGDVKNYHAGNSMQRAMLRCLQEHGSLERYGFFLLPDEIPAG